MSTDAYRQIIAASPRDRLDLFLATANRIGARAAATVQGWHVAVEGL